MAVAGDGFGPSAVVKDGTTLVSTPHPLRRTSMETYTLELGEDAGNNELVAELYDIDG